jgi:hypothetical protein
MLELSGGTPAGTHAARRHTSARARPARPVARFARPRAVRVVRRDAALTTSAGVARIPGVVLIEARRYRRLLVSYLRNGGNLVEIRQATECSHEEIRRLLRGQLVFVTEGRARRIETLLSAKGREWRAGRDATTSAWGWSRPAWSPRAQGGVRATRPASDRARARRGRATPHAGARARALAGWQLPEQASTAGSPGARGRRANEAAPCAANCTATDPKSQLSHAPT